MRKKLNIYHRFLKYKGIYGLAWRSFIKLLIIALIITIILVLAQHFINDLHSKINVFLQQWNTSMTLIIFFISETILGLIPPDFFIAWAGKSNYPFLLLSTLAVLSYVGGVLAFFIGRWIQHFPNIKTWLEFKLNNHLGEIKRYGGFLIVFSALLPLPFSTISLLAGMVNYPKKNFLLLGLTRLLRFYLYALVLFHVI